MPVDHFTLSVPQSKLEGVVSFLIASLSHMGFKEHWRPIPTVVGMGEEKAYIWIAGIPEDNGAGAVVENLAKQASHTAFTAQNGEQVRQFHAAALKAGGEDNGAPGLRHEYHSNYYAAFVRDPACGINIEVVCHGGDL